MHNYTLMAGSIKKSLLEAGFGRQWNQSSNQAEVSKTLGWRKVKNHKKQSLLPQGVHHVEQLEH